MNYINFSKANCKNCYKCVRSCPVKSIKVKNGQAEIVEELCIACGTCLRVCPQNAKEIRGGLENVKEMVRMGEKTALSIAPSYTAAFTGFTSGQLISCLRKLGFSYIEETAAAAKSVVDEYEKYFAGNDGENWITTSCPSANYLVRRYYPKLIKNLIPVKSPMAFHANVLKQKYGGNVKVIFAGPCLAKKIEADEESSIDAVLTFEELEKWIKSENIEINSLEESGFDSTTPTARLFPLTGGISEYLKGKPGKTIVKVDGAQECIEVMEALEKKAVKNVFVEINFCRNSCINGPAMPENNCGNIVKRITIENGGDVAVGSDSAFKSNEVDIGREFDEIEISIKKPYAADIERILAEMGKYKKDDELNCGTCGYNSCKEKAAAVYNGMAEKDMCLPHMRHRAEMITNTIFDNTPSIIFVLNDARQIIDMNPAAEKAFSVDKKTGYGREIGFLIDDKEIKEVIKSKGALLSEKLFIRSYGITVIRSAIYLENQNALLLIMHDISKEEKKEAELRNVKIKTIDMAQEVINKQMRVAQEIASLLGETTAETKVTLTKLKNIVQGEGD